MQVHLAYLNEHFLKTYYVRRTEKHFHASLIKAWRLSFACIVDMCILDERGLPG